MSLPEEVILGGMAADGACVLRRMMVEEFSAVLLLLNRYVHRLSGQITLCGKGIIVGGWVFVCAASCKQRFIFA
jgi:hypothetical protein